MSSISVWLCPWQPCLSWDCFMYTYIHTCEVLSIFRSFFYIHEWNTEDQSDHEWTLSATFYKENNAKVRPKPMSSLKSPISNVFFILIHNRKTCSRTGDSNLVRTMWLSMWCYLDNVLNLKVPIWFWSGFLSRVSSCCLFFGTSFVMTCRVHNHSIYFLGLLRMCRLRFTAKGTIIYTIKWNSVLAAHCGHSAPAETRVPSAALVSLRESPSLSTVNVLLGCGQACATSMWLFARWWSREDNLDSIGNLRFSYIYWENRFSWTADVSFW